MGPRPASLPRSRSPPSAGHCRRFRERGEVMRKAITLIAVTAIAAVLGAGLVSASSKEPSISAARDIHLVARATEQNFVDTGDPGPSLGDMFVFRERLSSEGQR